MPTAVTVILLIVVVLALGGVALVVRRRDKDPRTTATSQTPDRFHDVRRVDNTGN